MQERNNSETASLPEDYIRRMQAQLGSEFDQYIASVNSAPLRGIRINRLKNADLPFEAGNEIPWWQGGRYLPGDSDAGSNPLHDAGAYYIQEPSAMLPVAVLKPAPGERVLDLCAAPGGKTTQIGEMMQGKGLLVSNEPVAKRAQVLSRNVERMGIVNCIVTSAYPQLLSAKWKEQFHAILVDAPCSGEGMFRKNPDARREWTEENAAGCAVRQAGILDEAAKMLLPGGRLVYSTCTFNPEENQNNISRFLDSHGEFSLTPFSAGGISSDTGMITCYPHKISGEGHFVALLKKAGSGDADTGSLSLRNPTKQELAAFSGFGESCIVPNAVFRETMVYAENEIDLSGVTVLRVGLHMGSAKGKIFIPDHSWAVSSTPPKLPHIMLTAAQAEEYQAGSTILVSDSIRGYVLMEYCGIVLGFGKVSEGIAKNHYPKGLRK